MNYDKCYYDNEFKIRFVNYDENIDEFYATAPYEDYNNCKDYYDLIYVNGKETNVIIDKKVYTYSEPVLIIAKPRMNLKWYSAKQPFYRMRMLIHPNAFKNVQENDKVLEFFYKLEGEQHVFKLNLPQFSSLKNYIDSIQAALFARCGRFTMEARVNALISEIELIYEAHYKEYVEATDSVPAQIIDYIDRHYLEKITLQTICDKFFVSVNTVNAIVKKLTGFTFKQYIIDLRLKTANTLIKAENQHITTIAKLSGFSDYSSFIKTYKKHYGIPPSKLMKKSINPFPLRNH
ncbi:MAG: helix-turn-helix domain-containing protein [Acutalibacteraceae bacterium]